MIFYLNREYKLKCFECFSVAINSQFKFDATRRRDQNFNFPNYISFNLIADDDEKKHARGEGHSVISLFTSRLFFFAAVSNDYLRCNFYNFRVEETN